MPRPKFLPMPTVLAVIYALGIPVFILLQMGKQFLPGFAELQNYAWNYALICLGGLVCNVAILYGKRLGAYGQIAVWIVNAGVNFWLQRSFDIYAGVAILLAAAWVYCIYKNWSSLV